MADEKAKKPRKRKAPAKKKAPTERKKPVKISPEMWLEIRHAYCANNLRIKDIALAYGVAAATISCRATRDGWKRSQSAAVQYATQRKLQQLADPSAVSEEEVIDKAADQCVDIVMSHRVLCNTQRHIYQECVNDLMKRGIGSGKTEIAPEVWVDQVRLKDAVLIGVQLNTMAKGITEMERAAFNMDGQAGDGEVESLKEFMESRLRGDDKSLGIPDELDDIDGYE